MLENEEKSLDFLLVLGNSIFYNDEKVKNYVKTEKFKTFLEKLKIQENNRALLEAIKNYVNN